MARRTHGQRYLPTTEAVQQARARGQTNAAEALREYRESGGSIRTQEWYRVWRNMPYAEERADLPGSVPIYNEQPGREPRDWNTAISVIYWDPRTNTTTRWNYETRSGGPRRISDQDAMEDAITESNDVADKYEWVPVYAYVVSYEPIY